MRLLNAGCADSPLPPEFAHHDEVRLDINPDVKPDIVGSITDMGDIGEFDCVYTSHVLEHLWPHDVPKALSEFHRVLKHGGVVIVAVPDLSEVKATEDVVYEDVCGRGITGLDMIYGMRSMLAEHPYMAHRTGFTPATLRAALETAGFRVLATSSVMHNLLVVARKYGGS